MNVAILCGGKGTRVSSISNNQPKILLKVSNKYFIYILLDSLINKGARRIFLLTSYKTDLIKNEIGEQYRNIEITFLEDNLDLTEGTSSAILSSIDSSFCSKLD